MNIDFGLTAAAFSTDPARRTMTALVVPWNTIGTHADGRRWRFRRGSLVYGHAKYLRLNDEHVHSARLGRGMHAEETDEGLVVTFRVYDGPAGDRALALAGDGVKTGFSAEIEFDVADSEPDPDNPGVLLVNLANLTDVGFTRRPAFDDARLISVRASQEGTGMPDTDPTTTAPAPGPTPAPAANPDPAAAPVNPPVLISDQQLETMMATFAAGAARPTVDPTANALPAAVAPAEVTEPLPYRFSYHGERRYTFAADAEHDFSTDVFALMRPETAGVDKAAAEQRVNALIRAAFADLDTADVTALNPNAHRPDLWQPQMDYPTPLWDLVGSGSTDGRKFDVPKFNSSSALVGPATESTEPAGGAFTATLQTVTPTQVWGKIEITRQAWRAGGSPQLSGILWEQMLREYYEDREAAIATFLGTLTAATDIALTGSPASPTADNDQTTLGDFEQAVSDLLFTRGGNNFTAFAVHQALWRVGARGKDDMGRPLYPQINPSNANGVTSARYRTMQIAGVSWVPAYALGTVGTVSTNSWLFDPAKVRSWASSPERMFWDFGATVQTANLSQLSFVTLGIYGDVASACLDINGVRQVTYDPNTAV